MTRQKLRELKAMEEALTRCEDRQRAFNNCVNHGGDPRNAIRELFNNHADYHPKEESLKRICSILSNDLDEKKQEAKGAFENV